MSREIEAEGQILSWQTTYCVRGGLSRAVYYAFGAEG